MPSDIVKYNEVPVCKGIAIILMVLGHTSFSSVGNGIIYMFHMPLFIFMTGYCFKDKYVDTPRRFIINKLKRLYLPFVIWSIAFILHNVFYQLNIYNDISALCGTLFCLGISRHIINHCKLINASLTCRQQHYIYPCTPFPFIQDCFISNYYDIWTWDRAPRRIPQH